MKELEKIDLHDAVIVHTNLNVASRTFEVSIEYYADEGRHRTAATIRFHKVVSMSNIYDIDALQENATAGNISYWAPSSGGTTYIYLANGCMAVHAGEVEFS